MKIIAKTPHSSDEIKYLAIEYNSENDDTGVFLFYMLENDFKSCQYDTWFENLETAKQAALEEYGIMESDWANYEE